MGDSCLLQHRQKLWQCQVLEAEEKLCSTLCNSTAHAAELTPQNMHRTLVGLVLKGPNSAASSGIFIQMRLNLALGAISVPQVHLVDQRSHLVPARFSHFRTEEPVLGISDGNFKECRGGNSRLEKNGHYFPSKAGIKTGWYEAL